MNFIKIYAFFLLSITSYNFGMTGNINTPSSLTVLSEKESEKLFTQLNSSFPQLSQNIKELEEIISLPREYLKEFFNDEANPIREARWYYFREKEFYCNDPNCEKKDPVYIGYANYYKHLNSQHRDRTTFYCTAFGCSFSAQTAQRVSKHGRIHLNKKQTKRVKHI
ncbi:MAG: hypothetical protein WC707_03565 [Candidatus Babeliaceae bacterium]|jgi:hypothetical protein